MMRKLIVTAAVAALPAGVLAVGSGSAIAGAAKVSTTPPAATCALSGAVAFAKPGLTAKGHGTKASVSKWAIGTTETGTNCGTALNIKVLTPGTSANACTGTNVPAPGCVPGGYYYNKATDFGGSNLSSLKDAFANGIQILDGGNKYKLAATSATSIFGNQCGASIGYLLKGNVIGFGTTTWTLTLCYAGDTGTNVSTNQTNSSFWLDWYALASGQAPTMVITTALLNPTSSALVIS